MNELIKQRRQIIRGLSFDPNTNFISNKDLSNRIRTLLLKCNDSLTRESNNSENVYNLLIKEFENEGLPVIREILLNGYLVTNLDHYKLALQSDDQIVDKLADLYDNNTELRKWILRELSKFSDSNFESIVLFVKIFFIRLGKKNFHLKNILDYNWLNQTTCDWVFRLLTFSISKLKNNRYHKDEKFFKSSGERQLFVHFWKNFYLNNLNGNNKDLEIERITLKLINYVITKTKGESRESLIETLKLSGWYSTNKLFIQIDKIHSNRYKYFVESYAKLFLNWSKSQKKLHKNFIIFILDGLRSKTNVSIKIELLKILINTTFFGYKEDEKKYFIHRSKVNSQLQRFFNRNSKYLEPDLNKAISNTLKPKRTKTPRSISEPVSEKHYEVYITSIQNESYSAIREILNNSTQTLDFYKYILEKNDEDLILKFNTMIQNNF